MTKKFRVWDIQDKSFFSKEYLKEFKVSVSWDGQTIRQDFWGGTKTIGEDVIVQQWTGLTDSQGVEIYEGDIVSFEYRNEGLFSGLIAFDDMYLGFSLQKTKAFYGNIQLAFSSSKDLKIIGNIFQNPELLENARHSSATVSYSEFRALG